MLDLTRKLSYQLHVAESSPLLYDECKAQRFQRVAGTLCDSRELSSGICCGVNTPDKIQSLVVIRAQLNFVPKFEWMVKLCRWSMRPHEQASSDFFEFAIPNSRAMWQGPCLPTKLVSSRIPLAWTS